MQASKEVGSQSKRQVSEGAGAPLRANTDKAMKGMTRQGVCLGGWLSKNLEALVAGGQGNVQVALMPRKPLVFVPHQNGQALTPRAW